MTDKIDELINEIENNVSTDSIEVKEKESWFSKWKKKRKEEKEFKREIVEEAKREALQDLKPELVKQLKQKELDRLSGKSSFVNKIGKELERIGKKDFSKMMNSGSRTGPNLSMGSTGFMSSDKLNMLLGNKQVEQSKTTKPRKRKQTKKKVKR